jgi:hypothetical protein
MKIKDEKGRKKEPYDGFNPRLPYLGLERVS